MSSHDTPIGISIVIPIYNNVGALHEHWLELQAWCASQNTACEIILVDDGSDFTTVAQIARLIDADKNQHLIRHAVNRGQQAALVTGFKAARGKIALCSDADFVVPPTEFSRLVQAIGSGHDFAMGCRTAYRRQPWYRRWGALCVRVVIRLLYGITLRDFGCGTNAIAAALLEKYQRSTIPKDVLKLALLALSENPIEIDLACRVDRQQTSSYSFAKLAGLFVKILTFRFRARRYWGSS